MVHMEIIVKNLRATQKLAKKMTKTLNGGDVILFYGDLGSGKTTFIKSVAKYLGVKDNVTSPTFNIVKQYSGKDYKLYHFDLYRIDDEKELEMIGVRDILNDETGIVVVEWAENAPDYFEKGMKISIEKIDEKSRKFIIEDMK